MNSLPKWLNVPLRTKWLWVRIPLLSLKLQILCLIRARSSLTFRQTIECRFTLKLVHDMIIYTLNCTVLSIYFERFQIHLQTGKHLFSSRYRDSSLNSFSLQHSRLAGCFHSHYHFTLHTQLAVKSIFWWKLGPAIHILIWVHTFLNNQEKFFIVAPILAVAVRVLC